MATSFMIYGSYGYSGSLIAEQAVKNGMRPFLSGRDPARLAAQAKDLGLEYRAISLDDSNALEVATKEVSLVLNCAGPYRHTFKPVVDACLRTGCHYLDLTHDFQVIEDLARLDQDARSAGVMLLPGVGFDVVPSDCLALHLKQRLPQATHLILAIYPLGGEQSRGTVLSILETLPKQTVIRQDGKLAHVPHLSRAHLVDFGPTSQTAVIYTWGDVASAYYSTGIPNIEVYMVASKANLRILRIYRLFPGLSAKPYFQNWLKQRLMQLPPGPSAEARRMSRNYLWGEVSDEQGNHAVCRMTTPDGYDLTKATALGVVRRVLSGDDKPGFHTPALAYGADFILEFEGVQREDVGAG